MSGIKDPSKFHQYFVPEQSDRDLNFYDDHIAHYMARFGKKIEYLLVDVDSLTDDEDIVFGEDTSRGYVKDFVLITGIWQETEETNLWGKFGIVPTDEISIEVHQNTFITNLGRPPIEKDILRTVYNGLIYEVISVADDAKMFKGTKFTYTLECRPRILDTTQTPSLSADGSDLVILNDEFDDEANEIKFETDIEISNNKGDRSDFWGEF